jgi:hypothetical protein
MRLISCMPAISDSWRASCSLSQQPPSRMHTRGAQSYPVRPGSPDSSAAPSRSCSHAHSLTKSPCLPAVAGPSCSEGSALHRQYSTLGAPLFVDIASTSAAAGPVVVQHRGPAEASGAAPRQYSYSHSSNHTLSSERSGPEEPNGPPVKRARTVDAPAGARSRVCL